MRELGEALLGAHTFCASTDHSDECGANGLPLTPNSIKIVGRFQHLKVLQHPRLCAYVHIQRAKHERLIVVAEHYTSNLEEMLKRGELLQPQRIIKLAFDILSGLEFLHGENVVHRCLEPNSILFNSKGDAMLSNYGLYHITEFGADVSFPIGNAAYLPPEVLCMGPRVSQHRIPAAEDFGRGPGTLCLVSPKVDIWSVGVILLEVCLGKRLWENLSMRQKIHTILGFTADSEQSPLDRLLSDGSHQKLFLQLPEELQNLIQNCLTVSVSKRPTAKQLLASPLFSEYRHKSPTPRNGFYMFSPELRCKDLELVVPEDLSDDLLTERRIDEVFYLWQLAGGDLEGVLKKAGLMRTKPPISKLVNFVVDVGESFGQVKDQAVLFDCTVTILPQLQLRERLESIHSAAYYPLTENEFQNNSDLATVPKCDSSSNLQFNTSDLPLVIKERDVEYQFQRVVLYERLLKAYPYTKARIWKEARTDITPLYRAQTWAALLDVEGDIRGRYDSIDKETPTATDRQIEVDIPRCHQYNELLSSPEGHKKLKRVLKAWVVSHPEYVYWQGLDSLCAPFLHVSFNDEALAYACLDNFIPKYQHKLFLKDNAAVIQEYLAVFGHLTAFHDAELSCHLDKIGFIPDLYAIPWFLTMFAHAFPMHKIFHLWDTLLLGDSSFPLFIGVAILLQLREQLITFGFNECILMFSDMPDIDIQRCVQDSVRLFCTTPKSASFRCHSYHVESLQPEMRILENVSLSELKLQKCPHVTAEDLLKLADLSWSSTDNPQYKKNKSGRSKILIIDIRSNEEFQRGTIPGSINLPASTSFTPEGQLVPSAAVQAIYAARSLVKVIVGNRANPGMKFAEDLLALNMNKVCVLYNGIDSVRNSGVLFVPNT